MIMLISTHFRGSNSCFDLLSVFLIHPYFSEGKILKIDPTLRMCDYKIEYEAHKKFKNGAKSPVRVFTNVPLDKINFSASNSVTKEDATNNLYKYCKICDKHVFRVSKHCKTCNRCDSKDGKPCWHCFECRFCVKESWVHCLTCKSCHFPGNPCKVGSKSYAIDKALKQCKPQI